MSAVETLGTVMDAAERVGLRLVLLGDALEAYMNGGQPPDWIDLGVLEEDMGKFEKLLDNPLLHPWNQDGQMLTDIGGVERLENVHFGFLEGVKIRVVRRNPNRAISERYSIDARERGPFGPSLPPGTQIIALVYPSHHFVTMPRVEAWGIRVSIPSDAQMLLDWSLDHSIRTEYEGVL